MEKTLKKPDRERSFDGASAKVLTGIIALSMTLATAQLSHADQSGGPSSESVQSEYESALVEARGADAQYVPSSDTKDLTLLVEGGNEAVVGSPLSDSEQIQVTLPGTVTDAPPEQGGITVFETTDSYTTAVEDAGDGAFRALVQIESTEAPMDYPFDLEVPEGADLVPLEDGGAVLRSSDGEMLGTFAPPWAKDANGVSVPTEYLLANNRLIQRVNFTSATAFPVVADPFWIPVLLILGHITRHAATQAATRGVSQALIRQVINNGVKTAGNRGTSVFTQGKGANRIRVIVDNRTGNIITVTKG